MRGIRRGAALAVVAVLASAGTASADRSNPINAYRVKATAENIQKLAAAGYDVLEGRRSNGQIEIYGTSGQLRKLRVSTGVVATLVKDAAGRTSAARSVRYARIAARRDKRAHRGSRKARKSQAQTLTGSDAAFKVWRRYDTVGGDRKEQYREFYDRVSQKPFANQMSIGKSVLGRDIMAVRLTQDADRYGTAPSGRPAVLYNAVQHAREWLAGETCRRTLQYFHDNYGVDDRVTRLVNTRELWFVCISNPDGYEYTFTPGNRLWRKNMADNNSNGTYGENVDGVDPNRNFPVNWGLDNEGSSPQLSSETYRGTGPASEPETKAMIGLWDKLGTRLKFQKNDHTAAALLLYPQGWQQYTKSIDDPIFTALAGDDHDPAINSFDPDLGAELYITNGDTLDTAYNDKGILAYTPEGTEAKDPAVSGFEYEDSEGAIQAEFTRHRAFSLDLAESAGDPDDPSSHLKNTVEDFYVDAFPLSYGSPQKVQVLVKKALGDVFLRYRIAGGDAARVPTSEWGGGERYYKEKGFYYHFMRGEITGAQPGQTVEVWFENADGSKRSDSFTYRQVSDSGDPVLVLTAENYTGPTPAQDTSGPQYADEFEAAVAANGIGSDRYDVDANGLVAPHPLGVLSHYRAVLWDTGNDYLLRKPGQVPGTGTARLALEEMLAVRDYLNEGGKVFYGGKHNGQQFVEGFEFRNFGFPEPGEAPGGKWCDSAKDEGSDGCILHTDDFLQYYMGGFLRVDNGNSWNPTTNAVAALTGVDPFDGSWTFSPTAGDPGAGAPTSTWGITSSMIPETPYGPAGPYASEALARWQRSGAGPFSPFSGSHYMATGHDDEAYKRLATDIDLSDATSGDLTFMTSYDLEAAWDHIFVEVREVGTESWTTLPDANGHTSQATGDSCHEDGGWQSLHSRLNNYTTVTGDSCTPTGTTGAWNASTGSSQGWQQWKIDLTPYAGKNIEIAIVVATDWAVGNPGAFVDDAVVTIDGLEASATQFETDTGVWSTNTLPSSPNQATWERTTQVFDEAGVVGTADTVLGGFELGTMKTPEERAAFIGQVLEHLGVSG